MVKKSGLTKCYVQSSMESPKAMIADSYKNVTHVVVREAAEFTTATAHPIDFHVGECIAEDPRKSSVGCHVFFWLVVEGKKSTAGDCSIYVQL